MLLLIQVVIMLGKIGVCSEKNSSNDWGFLFYKFTSG
jgi:hypothetical protein